MDKRSVGILIFDGVEVLDFAGPFEVFSRTRLVPGAESRRADESAPFRVFTVTRTRQPVRATGGLGILPDHDFADAPAIDLLMSFHWWPCCAEVRWRKRPPDTSNTLGRGAAASS